jgi:hypothetical protein
MKRLVYFKELADKIDSQFRRITGTRVIKIECPECHSVRNVTVNSRTERDEYNDSVKRECKICREKIMDRYRNIEKYEYTDQN